MYIYIHIYSAIYIYGRMLQAPGFSSMVLSEIVVLVSTVVFDICW